jgi:hypothetical protein
MHALLEFDGTHEQLPSQLSGLTDCPSGPIGPGEIWWPSIGCGPIGEWWVLWATQPDSSHVRSGMVRSEVALWPLESIGELNSLQSALAELLGVDSIPAPEEMRLRMVYEHLLLREQKPPVICGLDDWAGILVKIWTQLWPLARRGFSARVALQPPQGGESVLPLWLYATPRQSEHKWSGHSVITQRSGSITSERSVEYLLGNKDQLFDEVLSACHLESCDLGDLNKVSRATDRLEVMRKKQAADHAILFLRTLLTLAPSANQAVALKEEALACLSDCLPTAPFSTLKAMANLKPAAFPLEFLPIDACGKWIKEHATSLALEEVEEFLHMLLPGKAVEWWRDAVKAAVINIFGKPSATCSRVAISWLSLNSFDEVLQDILPASEDLESRLFNEVSAVSMSKDAWKHLRENSILRKWSRLHAWATMQVVPEKMALFEQRKFTGNALPGLVILAEQLSGAIVVDEAVARPDDNIIELASQRTMQSPDLINQVDIENTAWRRLWLAHIKAGGCKWPPGCERMELGKQVVVDILDNNVDTLTNALVVDLADVVLDHSDRSKLWDKLHEPNRSELLEKVVVLIVAKLDAGESLQEPERDLADCVISQLKKYCTAKALNAVLFWRGSLRETVVIPMLSKPRHAEWGAVSPGFGAVVLSRGWKLVAKEIYRLSKDSVPQLRSAALACKDLLSWWDQKMLTWHSQDGDLSQDERKQHQVARLAELGANLAYDQLDYMWERAGGALKDLPAQGTPHIRWQRAATIARDGGLKNGLKALHDELVEAFPHNADLRELGKYL